MAADVDELFSGSPASYRRAAGISNVRAICWLTGGVRDNRKHCSSIHKERKF